MDIVLLFAARTFRLFAYGFLSVIFALYLAKIGLSDERIGLLLTLTLAGDAVITLWITTTADRIGRRRMLILGAALMTLGGLGFALTRQFVWLIAAAILGVISPSGNEIGPFLSIEQAALSQLVSDQKRTRLFAWYSLAGSLATAIGALCSGTVVQIMHGHGASPFRSYQTVVLGYAAIGLLLMLLFKCLSTNTEIAPGDQGFKSRPLLGLHQSRAVVLKLSGLFALDAFAGGFVIQSILAYWFYRRFGLQPVVLGSIFFGANMMAGLSSLTAGRLASRFGLINTMVFTHIPSNVLLILVPLMPSLPWAITVLLLRFSISQMDVPTRQSYTMAVVSPDERSAASGVTSIARSFGAMLTPAISGQLLAIPALMGFPFYLAGGLKIVYDLLLFSSFRSRKPPEEARSE